MKIIHKITLLISLLLLVVTLIFSVVIYREKKKDLLDKIDTKLYTSALFARTVIGENYHDNITGPDHFSKEEYLKIIDRYNNICMEQGLQYLWSLMVYNGQIVFTSSTTKDHDTTSGNHALFFDIHSTPEAYATAFETMQPDFKLNEDEWGLIRAVLVPFTDRHGRKYLFGASVTVASVDELLVQTVTRSFYICLAVLLMGIGGGILAARFFSRPIVQLKDAAEDIAAGHYTTQVDLRGSPEIESLSTSINKMSGSIAETILALSKSEERLDLALKATSDGIWDWDADAGTVYFSPRIYTMLGYEPNEFPSAYEEWTKRLHPDDREKTEQLVESDLKKGRPFECEFRMKMKEGGWTWILSRGRLVNADREYMPTRMVGTHTDISLRKETELALKQAKQEAEDASLAKSEFLTNMSHELRTPLNGMLGMLQFLAGTELDEEQQEYADLSVKSCRRLTEVLGNILDLSRIEAGKVEGTEEAFSLRKSFAPIRDLFSTSATQKGLDFSVHIDDAIPDALYGHRIRLDQILANIIGNAIKFTDTGEIKVAMEALSSLQPGVARILISISDTGIGIPDFMIPRIFKAFRQIEGSASRRFQGAGLGLSIAKRLVNMMGGTIALKSKEGVGSTFYVTLSFRETNVPTPESKKARADHQAVAVPGTILVVEDDSLNRKVVLGLLQRMGIDAQGAIDGLEALHLLKKQPYSLIFMDIQMPVMDGMETTHTIRNSSEFAHVADVPIVALTAHAMTGDRERILAAGMDDYMAKPIEADELTDLLRRHFPQA